MEVTPAMVTEARLHLEAMIERKAVFEESAPDGLDVYVKGSYQMAFVNLHGLSAKLFAQVAPPPAPPTEGKK